MSEFLHDLGQRILVFDGATGTNLSRLAQGTGVNILNLTRPADVRLLHESFIKAGADVIETNTYGANSYRLSLEGETRVSDINTRAVQIAREALSVAKKKVYVGGAIGPASYSRQEFETLRPHLADVFDEQIKLLVDAGIDLIVLETFSNPEELYVALKSAKKYGLPVVAQFGKINESGSGNWVNLATHAPKLFQNGADVVGINCVTPHTAHVSLSEIAKYTEALISIQPNAGSQLTVQGRVIGYSENPQAFATYARDFAARGANLIGGCCGTSPDYIAALVSSLQDAKPATRKRVKMVIDPPSARIATELERMLAEKKFTVGYEVRAPTNAEERNETLDVIDRLRNYADVFVCPDHPLNKPTIDSSVLGARIKKTHPDIEVIVTKGVSRRDLPENLGIIPSLEELGLGNLCVVYGDSELFNIRVHEVVSEAQKRLYVGTGFSPHGDLEFKLRLLERRVDAGAKFVLVQAMYNENKIREVYGKMRERFGSSGLKIFFGIYPILSLRNAMYMRSSPGDVEIPDELITAMGLLSKEDAKMHGIGLARRQVILAKELADGLILTQPIGSNPEEIAATVKSILS